MREREILKMSAKKIDWSKTNMEYRYLGRTGLKVSALSLGAWTTYGGTSDQNTCGEVSDVFVFVFVTHTITHTHTHIDCYYITSHIDCAYHTHTHTYTHKL